ncbi:hypothetical protein BHE74_00045518 [Ensete ventricosum]|nr:hypothetical protein BHE74_00045518 [Ensete ventricosum]
MKVKTPDTRLRSRHGGRNAQPPPKAWRSGRLAPASTRDEEVEDTQSPSSHEPWRMERSTPASTRDEEVKMLDLRLY